MTYSSAKVANYFLDKASREGRALTPMQLLKLVYIAHGWNLGYQRGPLIGDQVEAWQYGPVIGSLYHSIKHYGSGAVTAKVPEFFFSSTQPIDSTTASLLDSVWQGYSQHSGLQLSTLTHQPNTPWDITWKRSGGARGAVIDNELIKRHYEEKISGSAQ